MSLDVLTPKGRETVRQEDRAIELFEGAFASCQFVRTDKGSAAELDGVILRHGRLFATAEVKCRNVTRELLANEYRDEWLLSWDKVLAGMSAHALLRVGMVGLLYLVPDDSLLVVRILDDARLIVPSVRLEATQTQATVNGGSARRNNAYVDVRGATIVRGATHRAAA